MTIQSLIDALNWFLGLGVPLIAPVLLFVLAVAFRVPLGRAIRAALTYGVGFIGIFLILDLLMGALSGVGQLLVTNSGIHLPISDLGWPMLAAVAFGVPTFVTVFLGILVINIVMFALKWTKTLDIDFHNYYHWVLPATVVWFATGSLVVGTLVGLCNFIITIKIADWSQKYVEDWWELPGISIPHMSTVGWFPFCYAADWVLDRIPGVNKIRIDAGRLQERLGVVGEPMMVGVIVGLLMGLVARMPVIDLLNIAMKLAAGMVLLPRMIRLLLEGLVPIYQGARDWVVARFPGREFYVGLDAAVLAGKPEVLVNGLLMVPIIIILAVILPGNRVLPFTDLAWLLFPTMWAVAVNRGNIFRGLIIGTIICAGLLYGAGLVAPTMTAMGNASGFVATVPGEYTSLESGSITGSQLINIPLYLLTNPWVIAVLAVVLTAVLLFVFKWLINLPRRAADLPQETRTELAKAGWPLTA